MSRRPALVTQAEIARALRAAGDGRAVEILTDGTIRIVPLSALPPAAPPLYGAPRLDERVPVDL